MNSIIKVSKFSNIVLVLSIVTIFVSCSVRKENHSKGQTASVYKLPEDVKDSDSDGVPDIVEITRGSNPLVSNIPRLGIDLVNEISLGGIFRQDLEDKNLNFVTDGFLFLKQIFSEVQGDRAGDVDFLKVLRKKVIKNHYTHLRNIQAEKSDVIVNEDLRTTVLSKWDDKSFFEIADKLSHITNTESNSSGKFNAQLRLKITDAAFVTQVSNINVKSIYYNFKSMEENEIYNHFLLKPNGSKERIEMFGKDVFRPAIQYS